LEQRMGRGYKQEQIANSCCPLSCQGPEDLSNLRAKNAVKLQPYILPLEMDAMALAARYFGN